MARKEVTVTPSNLLPFTAPEPRRQRTTAWYNTCSRVELCNNDHGEPCFVTSLNFKNGSLHVALRTEFNGHCGIIVRWEGEMDEWVVLTSGAADVEVGETYCMFER